MDDLISRRAAKDAYCKHFCHPGAACPDSYCKEVNEAFDDVPSTESGTEKIARDIATILKNEQDMRVILKSERKQGHWIDGAKMQTCSVCRYRGKRSWSFCPNCGSRMVNDNE